MQPSSPRSWPCPCRSSSASCDVWRPGLGGGSHRAPAGVRFGPSKLRSGESMTPSPGRSCHPASPQNHRLADQPPDRSPTGRRRRPSAPAEHGRRGAIPGMAPFTHPGSDLHVRCCRRVSAQAPVEGRGPRSRISSRSPTVAVRCSWFQVRMFHLRLEKPICSS
jgi:hypothetical protein